jgi:hypothetical protein
MKTRITLFVLLLCLSFGVAMAQDAAAQAAWMEAMTPGEEHLFLKKMEGKWKVEVTSLMSGTPEVTKGTAVKKMILGGRYLEENTKSSMMGQPFLGKNIFAYDKMGKKFRTHWIDTMGTGFMLGEGTREGNTITIWSSYPDGMGGTMNFKLLYILDSDTKHRFEMYMVGPDGKDMKSMSIVYTK